ncbi:MAG: MBL fold metallo-hydrolase [Deltaproteobacteria bacterium]|nr:MBL fold metallo-hydrolase [Deltaproteobacteria bacterium]
MKTLLTIVCFSILSLSFRAQAEQSPLKLHFLNVGEGSAAIVQSPDPNIGYINSLIDVGNPSAAIKIKNYLETQQISELNSIYLSHPHLDHIGGIFTLLQLINTKEIYDNGEDLESALKENKMFRWYKEEVRQDKRYKALRANSMHSTSKTTLEILWPEELTQDWNTNSLVMLLTYNSFKCLIMNDANSETEAQLIARNRISDVDLLIVGHHGAQDASSNEFLDVVKPEAAIISVNKDNYYGHPSDETINRLRNHGVRVYRTDRDGDIIASVLEDSSYKIESTL